MYIYMLSDYLKETYGKKLHKLLLTSGFTCPNRDGKRGSRGCIFCSTKGAGEFSENKSLPISIQIDNAKKKLPNNDDKFIAYFQSFTNTYAKAEELEALYYPIVHRDDIAILDIATRPDCLSEEIITILEKLNKIKPVWIELGLQTIHEDTAEFIRRGYKLPVYSEAVEKLKKAGIKVITHLILGLPGETKEQMIESAKFAGLYSDGIKIHSLYITKDCDLAKLYIENKISLISKEQYIDALCECLRVIPENVIIHRLTGDADKNILIAPLWSLDKVRLLRDINHAFYDRNISQGENL